MPPRRHSRCSSPSEKEKTERIITALALRSYHLPNNSWCDDLLQYFCNNHPLLGICCHDRRHPVRFRMRIVIFIGSIVFGLAVTNVIWLWFYYNPDETVVTISTTTSSSTGDFGSNNNITMNNTTTTTMTQGAGDTVEITKGMIVLWTIGGGLHALFDNTIWFITACVCCLPGQALNRLERFKRFGAYFVTMAVVLVAAIATCVVVLRAVLEQDSSSDNNNNNNNDVADNQYSAGLVDDQIDVLSSVRTDASAYEFLISYAVELALALFVYYPLVGLILFSGFLGCGKVPILGGRPYEVLREQRLQDECRKKSSLARTDHTSRSLELNPV